MKDLEDRMPDYHTTFSLAVDVIKQQHPSTAIPRGGNELVEKNSHHPGTAIPPGGSELAENNGRPHSLGIAVGQTANMSDSDDIDSLKIVPAELIPMSSDGIILQATLQQKRLCMKLLYGPKSFRVCSLNSKTCFYLDHPGQGKR